MVDINIYEFQFPVNTDIVKISLTFISRTKSSSRHGMFGNSHRWSTRWVLISFYQSLITKKEKVCSGFSAEQCFNTKLNQESSEQSVTSSSSNFKVAEIQHLREEWWRWRNKVWCWISWKRGWWYRWVVNQDNNDPASWNNVKNFKQFVQSTCVNLLLSNNSCAFLILQS